MSALTSFGDNTIANYVKHPIQGAVSGYLYLQNHRRERLLEFSNTREYWTSRLKALAWSAAYSTQFEIGPFSEASIGHVGVKKGTAGYVDFVMTPTGGLAWMIAEDWLDKRVIQRWEDSVHSQTKRSHISNGAESIANPWRIFFSVSGRGTAPAEP